MHCNAQVVRAEYLDASENIGGRGDWFFRRGGNNPPTARYPTSTEPTRVGAAPAEGGTFSNADPGRVIRARGSNAFTRGGRSLGPPQGYAGLTCGVVERQRKGCCQFGETVHFIVTFAVVQFLGITGK